MALLVASCSKTEITTVYGTVDGTNIAVSYMLPLDASTQLMVHAYGKTPDDTIGVWIGDTLHVGDIISVPCDFSVSLAGTLPSVRFVTSDSIIVLDVDAGTVLHSTPQIITPITYTFSLSDSILYHNDVATCTIKDCPMQLYFSNSDSYVASTNYGFTTADSTAKVTITAAHIGTTSLRFYNSEYDTTVSVTVQARYDTYREPNLDFDDTRDSLVTKLGNPSSYGTDYVTYDNYQSFNSLVVYFDASDNLYYYTIEFTSQPTSADVHAEIEAFLAERYNRYLEGVYTASMLYVNSNDFGSATHLVSLANNVNAITYYNSHDNPIVQ